jgi:hypothetical protein
MDLSSLSGEYRGKVYRIVESQEKVATMNLLDTLAEQALLEELIETTKPSIDETKRRHYLIQTPFRYPPLKHGSRFGSRFEPSIFYAGQTLKSAICESAFYSFYFLSRCTVQYADAIINHKTSFTVEIQAKHHVDLTKVLSRDIQEKLTHKSDYQFTQSIGKQMRQESVASFRFFSARCNEQLNIGVFDINSIVGEPANYQSWEIKQTAKDILFYCRIKPELSQSFNLERFLVDGVLAKPSN